MARTREPYKVKSRADSVANGAASEQADRPAKRAKLLDDSDDESSDSSEVELKINDEYAKRFEHNQKRAELHRLEEKYGKGKIPTAEEDEAEESESDSEDDVSEDDVAELVTEALDAEIQATLQAIRNKDPRVYDPNVKFYSAIEEEGAETAKGTEEKHKPMTLKDYHTQNLLSGKFTAEDDEDAPKTYAQEQEDLKRDIVRSMHEAAEAEVKEASSDDDEDDGFLVRKSKAENSSAPRPKITEQDVAEADKDPETFLSNFMASRAWAMPGPGFAALEEDDDEEDKRADEFEEAYNLRFEDPERANEKLMTHARDAAAKYSVRREEMSSRKKAREAKRAKKEAEKAQREEEKNRLRKLRIEQMEEKVKRIREAAGVSGKEFKMEEWMDVLEKDWDDEKAWDEEMKKRFGDSYYTATDADLGSEDESDEEGEDKKDKKKRKPKKPTWDDDIDIKDLVPDFEDDEAKPPISLSDVEPAAEAAEDMDLDTDDEANNASSKSKKKHSKKARLAEKAEAKKQAKKDRRLIESLVDATLPLDVTAPVTSKTAGFRYRETSPTTFGLTPRDILLATDAQLNQFAGLKKLAAFRDPEKKKKDRKKLGKKARVREWRRETFGTEEEPQGGFERLIGEEVPEERGGKRKRESEPEVRGDAGVDIRGEEGGRKKKRRSKKKKEGSKFEA